MERTVEDYRYDRDESLRRMMMMFWSFTSWFNEPGLPGYCDVHGIIDGLRCYVYWTQGRLCVEHGVYMRVNIEGGDNSYLCFCSTNEFRNIHNHLRPP